MLPPTITLINDHIDCGIDKMVFREELAALPIKKNVEAQLNRTSQNVALFTDITYNGV